MDSNYSNEDMDMTPVISLNPSPTTIVKRLKFQESFMNGNVDPGGLRVPTVNKGS